jgi:hypothetical protein
MDKTEPRSSLEIAAKLFTIIPEDKQEFRNDIIEFLKRGFYISPELCKGIEIWKELDSIMHKHVNDRNKTWKSNVIDIYIGKPIK